MGTGRLRTGVALDFKGRRLAENKPPVINKLNRGALNGPRGVWSGFISLTRSRVLRYYKILYWYASLLPVVKATGKGLANKNDFPLHQNSPF
jgi:hypothetical protein